MGWLQERLYTRKLSFSQALALSPLALIVPLFAGLAALRRLAYRRGWLQSFALPVPVIVIGNLTVGGAGKTPLTLWCAQSLQEAGWRPGIVSRGYGGSHQHPLPVTPESSPEKIGDEPVLLARQSRLPVWVGQDRVAAAHALLKAHPQVNLLICDDGLQHYRLKRDAEIVVFDGRGAGNGHLLPLGPLREPLTRARRVQALVFNGTPDARVLKSAPQIPHYAMRLKAAPFYRLEQPQIRATAAELRQRDAGKTLHALAGIGDPPRFFRTLSELGLVFTAHPFPDHHNYRAADLAFCAAGEILLMTEKDAVKCARLSLSGAPEIWVLPVAAELPPELTHILLETIHGRKTA
ncbi:MAG: tetraacyldisaccharide 4'-kinase [Zoogloeaceae bacterium]|jgi:tetraacyldisaccharide 4'-kinase|nr:tetraacyldisaccharide 4'-kinase [Zoogloeaceae bacterium]